MNYIKHIAIAAVPAALLLCGITASAQNYAPGEYKVVNGVAYNKTATDNGDGTYTVDLQTFVTGKVHTETVKTAADIILVMDLSVSMNETGGNNTDYAPVFPQQWVKVTRNMTPTTRNNWYWEHFNANTASESGWNYLHNGKYYPVFSETTTGPTRYHIYVWLPEGKRYLYGTEIHEERSAGVTGTTTAIYQGTLYSGGWHWNDLDDAPTNTNRNYYYKVGDKYYPVKARRVQVGSVNTYQLIVPLPDGDKYLTGTTGSDPFVTDPFGHYESTYNTLYVGDLYHNGGWTYSTITAGAATSGHYYKHTDGQYYPVTKVRANVDGNNTYQASVTIDGTRYYLNGDTITETPCPVPFADPDCTIFYGPLYNPPGSEYLKREGLRRAVSAFIDGLAQKSIEEGFDHRLALVMFNDADNNVDYPDLKASGIEDSGNSHVVRDFVVAKDSLAELKNEFPLPMPAAAGGSYYAHGYAIARGLLDRELGEATGTDINNNRSIQDYEVPTLTGEDHDNYSKRPKIIITIGDFQVTSIATARTQANRLKALPNTTLVSVQVRRGTSATYDGYAKELASSSSYYYKAENFDEELIEKLMSVTDDIGGAEVELTESTVTVDVVSQAFNIPSGAGAPQLLVAPMTGQTQDPVDKADGHYVYYTFGTEVSPAAAFPEAEAAKIKLVPDPSNPNKLSTEGFDYSAHWCGPDNNAGGQWHAGGYKLILRFTVEPNEDAVGGPEVKTNTEESGIYVDGEPLVYFNQPTVKVPVSLWIKKVGLEGNDSAVFTIYYADPNAPENAGKEPHEMKYQSFTKVIVNSSTMVGNDKMVKIVGLDSKFFYSIKEDAWAWSYDQETDEIFTSDVLQNPIVFENEPKEGTVKHAEAIEHNVFSIPTTPVTP